jgi:hypothetical protein
MARDIKKAVRCFGDGSKLSKAMCLIQRALKKRWVVAAAFISTSLEKLNSQA